MSSSSTSNLLTARVVARNPYWYQIQPEDQIESDLLLGSTSGVSLVGLDGSGRDIGAPKTHVWLVCRQRTDRRSGLIRITTPNTAATYTITLNSTSISYDATGTSTVSEIYSGFADAINGQTGTIKATLIPAGSDSTGQPVYSGILIAPTDAAANTATASSPPAIAELTVSSFSNSVMKVYVEPDQYPAEIWAQSVKGLGPGRPPSNSWVRIYGNSASTSGGFIDGGGGSLIPGNSGVVSDAGVRILLKTSGIRRLMSVTPNVSMPNQDSDVEPLRWIHIGPAVDEG